MTLQMLIETPLLKTDSLVFIVTKKRSALSKTRGWEKNLKRALKDLIGSVERIFIAIK